MIELSEFKNLIVKPALEAISLGGPAAINLVTGTALVESNLEYLKQVGGPALSYFQIEPATHLSIKQWVNRPAQKQLVDRVTAASYTAILLPDEGLIFNLRYAAIICRLKYEMISAPLPAFDDAESMSAYHKKWYNTSLGAANQAKNVPLFEQAIKAD